jgi:molecular chaperone Hsp33
LSEYKDYIIRATAADGQVRAFAATTTNLVAHAQRIHGLSPVAAAGLGRLMTAAAMMGIDMKGEGNSLSIILRGGGPLGSLVVVATSSGKIKGYVDNPNVYLPLNSYGKLDVSGAVGKEGKLTVIKDLGLKEPYVGQVDIVSGEIGDDIAFYMASSEQKPSAVGLGVLVDVDSTVSAAGGFMIQPLPGASEEIIEKIENRISNIPGVSTLISEGKTPEEILKTLLDDYELKVHDKIYPYFLCDCNRERLESVLITLGRDELEDILKKDGKAELVCHYCNKKYIFDYDDIQKLIESIDQK